MRRAMTRWIDGLKITVHRICSAIELGQASIVRNWHMRTRPHRRACRINATVQCQHHCADVTITNISGCGAGLLTDQPLPEGGSIVISFPIHYLAPPIDVEATVKWATPGAAGLEFKSS